MRFVVKYQLKFNGDDKTVVWSCPDCAKGWNREKEERFNNILEICSKIYPNNSLYMMNYSC